MLEGNGSPRQEKEMDAESRRRKQSALKTLLEQFDVPALRANEASDSNLRWLLRNLAINNSANPMLDTTLIVVRDLLSR